MGLDPSDAFEVAAGDLERYGYCQKYSAHSEEAGKKMANEEHLKILLQGVEVWNKWREDNPDIKEPDLTKADLSPDAIKDTPLYDSKLKAAHLGGINLQGAWLLNANLQSAFLENANLQGASLIAAKMQGAKLAIARLQGAILRNTKLHGANMFNADLQGATLSNADLRGVDLRGTNLTDVNVMEVKYNPDDKKAKYQGVRVATCYGSPLFKRHAQDQDFLEEFQQKHPLIYRDWLRLADCGRSFKRFAAWSVGMALYFAIFFYVLGGSSFRCGEGLNWSWFTALYYSVVTFTTLGFGDVTPITMPACCMVMAEVICGYIMLGGLISILANKLARRS